VSKNRADLQKIKDKLREENNIEDLLRAIGCEYVKPERQGMRITAQLPDRFYSNNKRSVQVKMNDFLSCAIRSKADFKGDIFNLVSYIMNDKRNEELQEDLPRAKEFICTLFGWKSFLKGKKGSHDVIVKDYTASLKEIINGRKRRKEIKPNPVLPEETMDQYYFWGKPLPYKGWVEEGITPETQRVYGVGFDLDSKRIVFPLRNRFGKLVGVKGRIMFTEEDPERKYLYLYNCNNRYEWFNFYLALEHILIEKKVYIFESEKSCMKAHSYGVFNTLAIGASDIALEQADILKKIGLDIEIILCYDKGITIDEIKTNAQVLEGRAVYGMYDVNNLLDMKDAPVDKGVEIWEKLVNKNIYPINLDKNV
jgi:DNA primase